MIIVWDTMPKLELTLKTNNTLEKSSIPVLSTFNPLPIKTIFDSHNGCGAACITFTMDGKYLISMGSNTPQTISIWDWSVASESKDVPIAECIISDTNIQTILQINPNDETEFMTTGPTSVNFFIWDKTVKSITHFVPTSNSKDFKHSDFDYTYSTFAPVTNDALTGTKEGDLIVWSNKSLNNLSIQLEKGNRSTVKFVKLHNSAINYIASYNHFILTGGDEGSVKIFDNYLRLLYWFEKLNAGPILSISFSNPGGFNFQSPFNHKNDQGDESEIPDFVVSTSFGNVLQLKRNNATGSAVGAATVAANSMSKASAASGANKAKDEYSFSIPNTANSFGSTYDATISRKSDVAVVISL